MPDRTTPVLLKLLKTYAQSSESSTSQTHANLPAIRTSLSRIAGKIAAAGPDVNNDTVRSVTGLNAEHLSHGTYKKLVTLVRSSKFDDAVAYCLEKKLLDPPITTTNPAPLRAHHKQHNAAVVPQPPETRPTHLGVGQLAHSKRKPNIPTNRPPPYHRHPQPPVDPWLAAAAGPRSGIIPPRTSHRGFGSSHRGHRVDSIPCRPALGKKYWLPPEEVILEDGTRAVSQKYIIYSKGSGLHGGEALAALIMREIEKGAKSVQPTTRGYDGKHR